ncbi:MAG: hypothetical protein WCO00_00060 [Rhodospirillaceae bacterium]
MQSYQSTEAALFDPLAYRPLRRRRPYWGAIVRTLALVSTVTLSFFGVYELDQYWNGGRGEPVGMTSGPVQSYGPSINWGGRR